MAENLSESIMAVLDHINGIKSLQELLRLCQEELDNPDDKAQLQRIGLLLDSYASRIEYHFDELNCEAKNLLLRLKQAKQLIGGMPSVKASEDD